MKQREKRIVKEESYNQDANERIKVRHMRVHASGSSFCAHPVHQLRLVRITLGVKGCPPGPFLRKNKVKAAPAPARSKSLTILKMHAPLN